MFITSKWAARRSITKWEAYKGFLSHLTRLATSTQDNYGLYVKRFLDDMPDNIKHITPEHIENHILFLYRTLKASSCNKVLTAIRYFFRYLEDFNGHSNPAQKIKMLKEAPAEHRILSQEEYQQVIDSTNGHRRNMIVFLANSGLRASEFLALRRENISNGFIAVYSTKQYRNRQVPINNNIRNILDTNPTFFNLSKNHNYKWLGKQCHKAAVQAGIPHFSTHSLRHYFITQMILGGGDHKKAVPLSIVARIAGDTEQTILKVYTHIFDADLLGATNCLDK